MENFIPLLKLGLKRRSKDFFIIFYNIVFPLFMILLLGYLSSMSYSKEFTSYRYYSIVLIPFCIMMGITNVAYAMQDERNAKTAYRVLVAPITKRTLILAKFLSCFSILSLTNILTLTISKFIFNMDLQGQYFMILLSFTGLTFLTSAIGAYLGLACKNFLMIKNFMNLPIMIFGLLGGCFYPIASNDLILSKMISLSPLTWINHGIISSIYENNIQILMITTCIFAIIGILILWFSIHNFKREAFL